MKAVILAGGLGTRLSEETVVRPKPMVEIGGKPILWHIMKIYAAHGFNEFVVCLGYKGYVIKEYFANYCAARLRRDVRPRAQRRRGAPELDAEPWRVTLVDTGDETMTGGRLKRVRRLRARRGRSASPTATASPTSTSRALLAFHREQGTLATVTAVQPPGRFGALELEGDRVHGFREKPQGDGGWINGGFFVLAPRRRSTTSTATTTDLGARAARAPRARRPAVGLPARRLLAADGHAARHAQLQELWESRRRARGRSWT